MVVTGGQMPCQALPPPTTRRPRAGGAASRRAVMKSSLGTTAVSCIVLQCLLQVCEQSKIEHALVSTLLSDYNSNVRPVANASDAVQVLLNTALIQIVHVQASEDRLTAKLWIRMYWTDVYLQWDPMDYQNISQISLLADLIWRPDLVMFNSVAKEPYVAWFYQANVYSTGRVEWKYPLLASASCSYNVAYLPFDYQLCRMTFGMWTYSSREVQLNGTGGVVDLSEYIPSGGWNLLGMLWHRFEHSATMEEGASYTDITFYILMQRTPLHSMWSVVLPTALIVAVTAFTFYLPVRSWEKISLTTKCMAGLALSFLAIIEILPQQSDYLPLLSIFFVGSLLVLLLFTCGAAWVIVIHVGGLTSKRAPFWLRKLCFKYVAMLFCHLRSSRLPLDQHEQDSQSKKRHGHTSSDAQSGDMELSPVYHISGGASWNHVTRSNGANQNHGGSSFRASRTATCGDTWLVHCRDVLLDVRQWQDERLQALLYRREWMMIAQMVDRLLLFVAIAGVIILPCLIVGEAEHSASTVTDVDGVPAEVNNQIKDIINNGG